MYKIALSGLARAGKNTAATMLVKHLGLDENSAKIVALADPIKAAIIAMYPNANRECLYGPSELRNTVIDDKLLDLTGKPLTYRQMLIDLGTLGRKYNTDFWLDVLIQDTALTYNKNAYILVDGRFKNEIDYLCWAGFFMVRIKRNQESTINDVSETGQANIPDSKFHAIIENYEGLDELDKKIQLLAQKIHNFAFTHNEG